MATKTWTSFLRFWKARGLTPDTASKILAANYLVKNYSTYNGFMWQSKTNQKIFKSMVDYIYFHMTENKMKWRAALLDLCKRQDTEMKNALQNMLVPGAVVNNRIAWSPATFAKNIGLWRQYFFDQGWLNYDERPEVKIRRIERTLTKAKILKKKKKKR